ncbi:MAG: hypothetical protein HZC42_06885 [Candidatus Eisenbacteria bacterium]|nr:hypothetical protein [Candidatus Eisenbacteria bacterium]
MDGPRWSKQNPPPLVRPGVRVLMTPIPDWLAERPEISWPAKFLYCRLRRFAGRRVCAWPTQPQLARLMRSSERSVRSWLVELRKNHAGMPLLWANQAGDGRPARYFFTAHPWGEEAVDNYCAKNSARQNIAGLSGSGRQKTAGLTIKDRARASGRVIEKTESHRSAGGGAARRGRLFTPDGHQRNQARLSKIISGAAAKLTLR